MKTTKPASKMTGRELETAKKTVAKGWEKACGEAAKTNLLNRYAEVVDEMLRREHGHAA